MTTFTTDDRLHAEKDGSFTIDCRLKPLSIEQIALLSTDPRFENMHSGGLLQFAREIEKAHGIR